MPQPGQIQGLLLDHTSTRSSASSNHSFPFHALYISTDVNQIREMNTTLALESTCHLEWPRIAMELMTDVGFHCLRSPRIAYPYTKSINILETCKEEQMTHGKNARSLMKSPLLRKPLEPSQEIS